MGMPLSQARAATPSLSPPIMNLLQRRLVSFTLTIAKGKCAGHESIPSIPDECCGRGHAHRPKNRLGTDGDTSYRASEPAAGVNMGHDDVLDALTTSKAVTAGAVAGHNAGPSSTIKMATDADMGRGAVLTTPITDAGTGHSCHSTSGPAADVNTGRCNVLVALMKAAVMGAFSTGGAFLAVPKTAAALGVVAGHGTVHSSNNAHAVDANTDRGLSAPPQ